ncbi:MAG: YhbY family RNA-binding protein [Clostridia bacterium]|jgi:RNA-binding protein|nr:YhbY family RNA-binding protein [Oscillospiraceae bacterium]MBQ3523720.1 YhbY family RNA-binding protein [Clostridia bacterium]MBR5320578.1 YhbY family RNA-binding protein [Clostridia bacterium]MBR5543905.1 YhbY family RNA-binding protein [Clostridia bacterium]
MTSKERAYWRGQANGLQALFQVGKGGISDALIKQTDDALKARELIKIKVLLETSPEKPKEIAQKLAEATNSDCVGVIGGSMIFYRYNPELHKDEKKKAKGRK